MVDRRNSQQKQVIKEAIVVMDHPTASEVYAKIHDKYPQISLGTVYRNLGNMADDGQALRLSLAGAADRFDPNTFEHYHAMCRSCGAIYDVPAEIEPGLISKLDEVVEKSTGIKVQQHNLVFEGVCPACQ